MNIKLKKNKNFIYFQDVYNTMVLKMNNKTLFKLFFKR